MVPDDDVCSFARISLVPHLTHHPVFFSPLSRVALILYYHRLSRCAWLELPLLPEFTFPLLFPHLLSFPVFGLDLHYDARVFTAAVVQHFIT